MDFIRIHNRKNFLVERVPDIHPQSTKYLAYWRKHKRRIVEGFWAPDDAGIKIDVENFDYKKDNPITKQWRWMPPNLYFYVNFGTIRHREGKTKTASRKKIRPYLRDFEWEFFYNYMECRGFSGFEDDDEYTCCVDLLDPLLAEQDYDDSCFNSKGQLKTYIPAKKYIRQLFEKPLGRPLYRNSAKDLILLGARGGGKSFLVAVGVVLHQILVDGAKYYTEESIKNPSVAEVFVGAAIAGKSSEMLDKTEEALRELPGAWKKNTDEEVPSPLYKEMTGSLAPNNMKSPWIHSYEKKTSAGWSRAGTGSSVFHGVFTSENPEAAAGGRKDVIVVEEAGLAPNLLTIHGSNSAVQTIDGIKYGSSIYIGTGGNIQKIIEAEILFRDPDGHDFLAFDDIWENTGKIGWFVPAYYMNSSFKDENGNTDVEQGKEYYLRRRAQKKKSKSRKALDMEMMNYPLVPSEMFLDVEGNRFPVSDLKVRLGELTVDRKLLDSSWKGHFSINEDGEVKWNNQDVQPIREYPFTGKGESSIDGCVEILEHPVRGSDGKVPYGVYIAGYDPVDDDDNADETRSLQSFFIMNLLTERVVLEYTARTKFTKDYYEQVRRALMYYNAVVNYENQKKGFYGYMYNKNSTYLLAETPRILADKEMSKMNTVGNKAFGVHATERINNWGVDLQVHWLESQAYNKPEGVTNVSLQRSIGYLKEAIAYNGKMNADRIRSMGMLMILKEDKEKVKESMTSTKPVRNRAKELANMMNRAKGYNRALNFPSIK